MFQEDTFINIIIIKFLSLRTFNTLTAVGQQSSCKCPGMHNITYLPFAVEQLFRYLLLEYM